MVSSWAVKLWKRAPVVYKAVPLGCSKEFTKTPSVRRKAKRQEAASSTHVSIGSIGRVVKGKDCIDPSSGHSERLQRDVLVTLSPVDEGDVAPVGSLKRTNVRVCCEEEYVGSNEQGWFPVSIQ